MNKEEEQQSPKKKIYQFVQDVQEYAMQNDLVVMEIERDNNGKIIGHGYKGTCTQFIQAYPKYIELDYKQSLKDLQSPIRIIYRNTVLNCDINNTFEDYSLRLHIMINGAQFECNKCNKQLTNPMFCLYCVNDKKLSKTFCTYCVQQSQQCCPECKQSMF